MVQTISSISLHYRSDWTVKLAKYINIINIHHASFQDYSKCLNGYLFSFHPFFSLAINIICFCIILNVHSGKYTFVKLHIITILLFCS